MERKKGSKRKFWYLAANKPVRQKEGSNVCNGLINISAVTEK